MPIGETDTVMLRSDDRAAIPVVGGIPILLRPEILTNPLSAMQFNLATSHYAEAYNETPFYDSEAAAKAGQISASTLVEMPFDGLQSLGRINSLQPHDRADFPNLPLRWIASRVDSVCEWDCYTHMAPIQGKLMLQLGGSGEIAMSMLLARAAAAFLVTPMVGEARLAIKLAETLGLSARFDCVVGIAEEIPLPDASLDVVFSGGCVHHMTTELAFPETARVLRSGSKFASMEPWRAPFYGFGSRVFGKR